MFAARRPLKNNSDISEKGIKCPVVAIIQRYDCLPSDMNILLNMKHKSRGDSLWGLVTFRPGTVEERSTEMPKGGKRPGAGRPRGSVSVKTAMGTEVAHSCLQGI